MVHTAEIKWQGTGEEFFFVSLDGEKFVEVGGLPEDKRTIDEDSIQAAIEGRGRPIRPMLWHRRALDALHHEGHGVTISGWTPA